MSPLKKKMTKNYVFFGSNFEQCHSYLCQTCWLFIVQLLYNLFLHFASEYHVPTALLDYTEIITNIVMFNTHDKVKKKVYIRTGISQLLSCAYIQGDHNKPLSSGQYQQSIVLVSLNCMYVASCS